MEDAASWLSIRSEGEDGARGALKLPRYVEPDTAPQYLLSTSYSRNTRRNGGTTAAEQPPEQAGIFVQSGRHQGPRQTRPPTPCKPWLCTKCICDIFADFLLLPLQRVEKFSSTAYSGERIAENTLTVTPEETKTNVDNVTCTGLWVGVRPHRAAVLRQQKSASVGDDPVTQAALDVLKKIDKPFKASVNSVVALDVLPVWPHEEFMTKVVVSTLWLT